MKRTSVMHLYDLVHYELTGEPVVLTMRIDTFDGRATIESNVPINPFGLLMALMSNKHFNNPDEYLGQVIMRTESMEDGKQEISFHHLYDDKLMIVGQCRLRIIDGRTSKIDNVTIHDVKRIVLSLDPNAHDLVTMHPNKIRHILAKKSGFHYVKFEII